MSLAFIQDRIDTVRAYVTHLSTILPHICTADTHRRLFLLLLYVSSYYSTYVPSHYHVYVQTLCAGTQCEQTTLIAGSKASFGLQPSLLGRISSNGTLNPLTLACVPQVA
jgi:hypothetical protein